MGFRDLAQHRATHLIKKHESHAISGDRGMIEHMRRARRLKVFFQLGIPVNRNKTASCSMGACRQPRIDPPKHVCSAVHVCDEYEVLKAEKPSARF